MSDSVNQTGAGQRETLTEFRARFHEKETPGWYSGWAHFLLTTGTSVAAISWAVSALDPVQPLEWLTIPLTFIYATLAEYFGHRGPMHHPRKGLRLIYHRHTRQHHRFFTHEHMNYESSRDFKAVLFPFVMIVFFFIGFGGPIAALIWWLLTPNVALLFIITAVAYFLNYELFHFIYHCDDDSLWRKIPGINRLRQLHLNHHNPELMQHHNFNITYPIGDWLFGTWYKRK